MQSALDAFHVSIARARHMHGIHNSLEATLTIAVDLTDMLRAELVMAVSALDHYVHEITRLGMLECWSGIRPKTDAFNRFSFPMGSAALLANVGTAESALDNAIRTKHSFLSFQKPDKIADAVRLFSSTQLWEDAAVHLGMSAKDAKITLGLIVDRRNKIAHEADVDPSFPGQRWPIDPSMTKNMVDIIEAIGNAIHMTCA